MKSSKTGEEFSKAEAQRRFEAALRGARSVGHKPMSEMKVGKAKSKAKPAKEKQKKPGR